jgi:N-acetylglucosaminyl-diphospho-decaprenol L-rhamnosyltransferase
LWRVHEAVTRHDGGASTPPGPAVSRFKGFHMARSRYYVLRKYGKSWPYANVLLGALGGLILPHNLFSARRRAKYLGQVSGAFSVSADGGMFGSP